MRISSKESYALSIMRVVACILILICHTVEEIPPFSSLNQLFNVGNDIFFVLSGYLIGIKEIDKPLSWVKRRLKRILIPYYIVGIIICMLFWRSLSLRTIIAAILNLQAFIHIYLPGSPHLWYISVLMLLYFLAPISLCFINKSKKKRIIGLWSMLFIAAIIISVINSRYEIVVLSNYILYYILFAFGIYLGSKWNREVTLPTYIMLTVMMIFLNCIRLILIRYTNNNPSNILAEKLYSHIYACCSHGIFALWICATIYIINNRFYKLFSKMRNIVLSVDAISYEIYLVHEPMIKSGILKITPYMTSSILIFIILTIIWAIIVNKLSKLIVTALKRGKV